MADSIFDPREMLIEQLVDLWRRMTRTREEKVKAIEDIGGCTFYTNFFHKVEKPI